MTDWEMKVHNFMCLNKFVKKGEIVFTGSSLCELFPINEMLQNVEPRIRVVQPRHRRRRDRRTFGAHG